MRSVVLAVVSMMVCRQVLAQVPPVFDMVDWCKAHVASGSFPVSGVLGCVRIEEFQVRRLQGIYAGLPEDVREDCEAVVRDKTDGLGSYAMLNTCIEAKRGR